MAKNKLRKPGSGRTTGATSFVTVKLSALKEMFKSDNVDVVVSRRWAENLGIEGKKIEATTSNIKELATPTVDLKVTNF